MLFSYIAMIAICALRISQYIAYLSISQYIANILQYIVYCNNILYIATIFKISRQYLVYRDNISRYIAIHPEYIAMLSKVYSATAIYHSSNASSSSSLFGLQYNNITIYRSLGNIIAIFAWHTMHIAIFASGSNIWKYCIYCNILQYIGYAIYGSPALIYTIFVARYKYMNFYFKYLSIGRLWL